MSEIFATIRLMVAIGGGLVLALLILLSLPQSRLKEILQPILGWGISAMSVGLILSPINLLPEAFLGPFGLADDVVALVVAVLSAKAAMDAGKETKQLP